MAASKTDDRPAERIEKALEARAAARATDRRARTRVEIRICAGTACHASGRAGRQRRPRRRARRAGPRRQGARRRDRLPRLLRAGPHRRRPAAGPLLPAPEGQGHGRHRRDQRRRRRRLRAAALQGPRDRRAVALEKDIPFYAARRASCSRINGKIDPYSHRRLPRPRRLRRPRQGARRRRPGGVIDEVERVRPARPRRRRLPGRQEVALLPRQPGREDYVICNGDEGDPGAFMDRSVLEGNPHSRDRGHDHRRLRHRRADEGYVYVRHEYPFAVERLRHALEQARERGLLGDDILGSGFDFDIRINQGAGAFVCGESTALTASIEGQRGMPRGKHIRTVAHGLWRPAHQPQQRRDLRQRAVDRRPRRRRLRGHGHRDLARAPRSSRSPARSERRPRRGAHGRHAARGHLRHRRRHAARPRVQGRAARRPLAAAACRPTCSTRRSTSRASSPSGSMMGSGGMVVVDDTTCMVDFAKFFLQFTAEESCGKCVPCRVGTTAHARDPRAHHRRRGHARRHRPARAALPTTSSRARSARSAAAPPTRCSPRCGTSATSTWPTWSTSAARPRSAGRSSATTSTSDACTGCRACVTECPTEAHQRRAQAAPRDRPEALHQVRHLPPGLQVRRRHGRDRRAGRPAGGRSAVSPTATKTAVKLTIDGKQVTATRGRDRARRGAAATASTSPRSATKRAWPPGAPAASAWSRSRARQAAGGLHHLGRRRPGRADRHAARARPARELPQDVPLRPQLLLRGAVLARLPDAHRHPGVHGGASPPATPPAPPQSCARSCRSRASSGASARATASPCAAAATSTSRSPSAPCTGRPADDSDRRG